MPGRCMSRSITSDDAPGVSVKVSEGGDCTQPAAGSVGDTLKKVVGHCGLSLLVTETL